MIQAANERFKGQEIDTSLVKGKRMIHNLTLYSILAVNDSKVCVDMSEKKLLIPLISQVLTQC